ncbi:hypothetical protein PTE30175_04615 [Pandoraea terrae]|uniref:Zinc finger/thioredoxin putative domain-containing protein n=1 Tax=Pandoraea terrae TaxID=1537710 RepID=A0A5E4YRG1_9BURK|nr:DUF3426 domain-containing protein [Pandoraea terrae]VVE51409.1 hypothetical protein PTE30175_04615 [Pandoraea terrae]
MVHANRVLATCCPNCHTVFRVVADQLKLRDGLVRCGQCRHVFDGRAHLCEPPGEAAEDSVAPESRADARATGTGIDTSAIPRLFDGPDTAESGAVPAPCAEVPSPPFALLRAEDATVAEPTPFAAQVWGDVPGETPPAPIAPASRPRRRIAWRAGIGIAVLALIGQWAWLDREALVDRWPALRAPLAQWAAITHGDVALPHQREALSIENVTLQTDADAAASGATATAGTGEATDKSAPSGPTASDDTGLTLTVFLRNKADHAIAYPSLELTLSDTEAKPVARRVFSADEYLPDAHVRSEGLPARSERTIRLRLTAQPDQAAAASNYRVLAFYP